MEKEIKRNDWAKFCKKFSSTNQYREVKIRVRDNRKREINLIETLPFMGITLAKKGRLIDGLEIFSGRGDAEKILAPVASFKDPLKVFLKADENGYDNRLRIIGKDGSEIEVELYGEPDRNRHYWLVEKVAYSMFEKRGYTQGNDQGDWLEAERKVKEAELQLIS